jgi:NhaP-type Na+/H+ or K+/H+ antiporter
VGRLVLYLRRTHREAVGTDDFLALGLIGLSYGVAVMAHGYGFLAVFAAGVALRHLERRETASAATAQGAPAVGEKRKEMSAEDTAVDPQRAPAHMAQEVLGFNEKLERIGEVAVVIAVGALLWAVVWIDIEWWLVPLLLLVVRPVSVALGLWGSRSSKRQRLLIGWFGIRGIGSLYYLMYAINHGLPQGLANKLTALTLLVIVSSIVLHGVSVTPLMKVYEKSRSRPRRRGRVPRDAAAP